MEAGLLLLDTRTRKPRSLLKHSRTNYCLYFCKNIFIQEQFTILLTRAYTNHPVTPSVIHSFTRLLINTCINLLIHPSSLLFIHSLIHCSTHSLIPLFNITLVQEPFTETLDDHNLHLFMSTISSGHLSFPK